MPGIRAADGKSAFRFFMHFTPCGEFHCPRAVITIYGWRHAIRTQAIVLGLARTAAL